MNDIIIVEASLSDCDGILKIYRENELYHYENLPERFLLPDDENWAKNYVERSIKSNFTKMFVAKADNKIIGVVSLDIKYTIELPTVVKRSYGYISNLIVTKKERKKGIGKLLIEAVENYLKNHNIYELELSVYNFNENALNFYKKLSFNTISKILHKKLK